MNGVATKKFFLALTEKEKNLWSHWRCENVYFIFILLASPPKKNQTERKNVGRDTATAVANYSGPRYYRNKRNKNKKY